MDVTETTVSTTPPIGTRGRYWHQLGDGRIQCDLCPRFCKLREGQRGLPATLRTARQIALERGLHYVYTGNVHDEAGQSTYCHHCGERLIGRDWYDITSWAMTPDGGCVKCGKACAGVFEPHPGVWGSRRLPVRALAL